MSLTATESRSKASPASSSQGPTWSVADTSNGINDGGGGGGGGGVNNSNSNRAVTRIPLACQACRTRKQKCDGVKGPLKGYAEMLESRLIRTEELLIRALALLDDAQVTSVVYGSSVMSHTGQGGNITFERPDPAYWSDYPLDTPEDIRRWWHAKSGSVVRQGVHRPSRPHRASILPSAAFGSVDEVDKRRRDSIERMPEPEIPARRPYGDDPGSEPGTLTRRLTDERPSKRSNHRAGRIAGDRDLDQDVFW